MDPVEEASTSGSEDGGDFEAAADLVAALASSSSLPDALKLQLYGLYKQATVGPCKSRKPAFWDPTGRAKWEAWHELHAMLADEAKARYIAAVAGSIPEWREQQEVHGPAGGGRAVGKPMGPVVSSLYSNREEQPDGPAPDGLHVLASKGHLAEVQLLLAQGADPNQRDAQGCTPLHWAADGGSVRVAHALLDAGAQASACDEDGQTPLHYSALCEHMDVCTLLLQRGGDAAAQDSTGQRPQDVAPANWATWFT